MPETQKADILGVPFDNIGFDAAADVIEKAANRGIDGPCGDMRTKIVVTPNAEIVYDCYKNPELMNVIRSADMILPDSIGIIYASRILGRHIRGRVPGVEIAAELCRRFAQNGTALFILGGKPGVAERAAANLAEANPGLKIAGAADGFFADAAAAAEAVNASGADALFVCLGSPKQERFMAEHRDTLRVAVMMGLGGSADIFAGTAKRAPRWMLRLGLEWLYRLIKEPSRFRRQLKLPKFLCAVIWRKLRYGRKA